MSNPCIKCGKPRIDGKTWEVKIGATSVVNTQTICPDADCQKLVDAEIAERKAKAASIIKAKEAAKEAKAKLLTAN